MMKRTFALPAFLSLFLILSLGCSKYSIEREPTPTFEHEIFSHTFDTALADTATGDFYELAYSYPAIEVDPKFEHVVNFMITPMAPCLRESIPSHGPLILIADDLETIVFSPMDHFFVSLVEFKDGRIHYGIEGEVREIPAGMSHRFLLVRGQGVNGTVEAWGKLMRDDHGRELTDRYADTGLSYLGYWTDNGAAYYYRTHEDLNEEDTLFAVKQYAQDNGIPYGYFQLDSWWYYKTSGGGPLDALTGAGLVRWEPIVEMFPSGLVDFQQRFGLPLVAHNRWFAQDNDYTDDFTFIDGDEGMALPLERGVFDRFMEDAVSWGVFTYEQDWLVTQYWAMGYLREGIGNAETWMDQMHGSAVDHGLTMQLCMASMANFMDAPVSQLAALLPVSERTIQRYTPKMHFNSVVSEYILHIAEVVARGIEVFEDKDRFLSWLNQPSTALGGQSPKGLLTSRFGTDMVLDELTRIEHGIVS